jgi:rsbT co-antagonist protein RsbR
MTGYGDALIGMRFIDHFRPEHQSQAREAFTVTRDQRMWRGILQFQRKDGTDLPVEASGFAAYDQDGEIIRVMSIFHDISQQQQAEAERAALQQQVIDAQRDALRELSTPLIPIAEHVVIMPLIGTIDSRRAQMVMETLLEGVARHEAELVILDITGVMLVDTQVAQALVRTAQAVKLLGAQVLLTGIQPQIAQTLVELGGAVPGMETYGTLQSGMLAALQRIQAEPTTRVSASALARTAGRNTL